MAAGAFVGIDVGGRKKGVHAAALGGEQVTAGPEQLADDDAVVEFVRSVSPTVAAVDSPRTCAPGGERSRAGERDLARNVCGIRWKPEQSTLDGNAYYEWIINGLDLYAAVGRLPALARPTTVIEVFPTASWTVWAGRRGQTTRARWTRTHRLDGAPYVQGGPIRRR